MSVYKTTGDYVSRYGNRPVLGIYTDWPQAIFDPTNNWNVHWLGPSPEVSTLEKHVVRVHDRKEDSDIGHILYVKESAPIDISKLSNYIDLTHTTFVDANSKFAIYRRDVNYNIKIIDLTTEIPSCGVINRLSGQSVGVIFIDCWTNTSKWQHPDSNFNFYQNMLVKLSEFNISSYVFHTSFINLDIITPDIIEYVKHIVVNGDNPKSALQDLFDFSGDERVSPELHNILFNRKSVLIPSLAGFTEWVQRTNIRSWIVVGMHWGICTHEKPLGFNNLKQLKDANKHMNFYSLPECTAVWVGDPSNNISRTCVKSDYMNDTLTWNFYTDIAELI